MTIDPTAQQVAAEVPSPVGTDVDAPPPGRVLLSTDPDDDDHGGGPAEWAWVREWRTSGEPVPWGRGIALAAFTLVLVASAIFVLTAGVAETPWLAVVLNLVVACGIGPQLWLARNIPVVRFIAWGAALGVPVGWLTCFVVPFPT